MASINLNKLDIRLSKREIADQICKLLSNRTLHQCDIRCDAVWTNNPTSLNRLITVEPEMVKLYQAAAKIACLNDTE